MVTISFLKYYVNHSEALNKVGLAYAYFSIIGTKRFAGDLSFTLQMYNTSIQLLRQCHDASSVGRGLTVATIFTAHFFTPISEHLGVLEEALELALVSGDKHLYLFTVSSIASCRLHSGFDMADVEMYCSVAPEDFHDWEKDLRGGAIIIACRQLARSLQGKTLNGSAETVMSDENHSTANYVQFVKSQVSNPGRYVTQSFIKLPDTINLGLHPVLRQRHLGWC